MNCNLCHNDIKDKITDNLGKIYHICSNCGLIQLDKGFHLSIEAEKQRYMLHENSNENKGYITYLNNIITNSITPFLKPGNRLFDFGCGPEKTWAGILKEKGYNISTYDPYFDNNREWSDKYFDAITAIEVFEHLLSPAVEIEFLSSHITTGSFLIIRTMLHNNNRESFLKWWYREDPTHVSFYSETAIMYICRTWNYELIQIKNQCEIVLKKK